MNSAYVVTCRYLKDCINKGKSARCLKCEHNRTRNVEVDFFVEANDNPIPDECPRLTFEGPAEQTAGYKCPVCGNHTSPYAIKDSRCDSCGYKLNIG